MIVWSFGSRHADPSHTCSAEECNVDVKIYKNQISPPDIVLVSWRMITIASAFILSEKCNVQLPGYFRTLSPQLAGELYIEARIRIGLWWVACSLPYLRSPWGHSGPLPAASTVPSAHLTPGDGSRFPSPEHSGILCLSSSEALIVKVRYGKCQRLSFSTKPLLFVLVCCSFIMSPLSVFCCCYK